MSQLVVHEVVAGEVIDVAATHPDTGKPVRRTTWSGVVALRPDTDDGTARHTQVVSFFLPDGRPFRPVGMTGMRAAARAALAGVPPDAGADERLEVARAWASISDDPRGGEHLWLELHLDVRAAGLQAATPWTVAYVVDLVVPHRPPAGEPPI